MDILDLQRIINAHDGVVMSRIVCEKCGISGCNCDHGAGVIEASCYATFDGILACTMPERIHNKKQAFAWLGY